MPFPVEGDRQSLVRFLVAVLWIALVVGCADDPPALGLGEQCDVNSECEAPLVCRLGRCRRECATLRDCPIEALCVTDEDSLGACTLPEEETCTLNSECPEPLVCAMGRCVNECAADVDCAAGAVCEDRACIDTTEDACVVDGDCSAPLACAADRRCRAQCVSSRDCREGTVCEGGSCARPAPLDAGPTDGATGADGGMDAGSPDVDGGWDPTMFWRDGGPDGGPLDGSLPLCVDGGGACPAVPLATTACVDGRCEIVSCEAPHADCNGVALDGCETNTTTHRDHCTACGSACPAGQACLDAACVEATVTDVSVQATSACALWSTGDVTCWGHTIRGVLGNGGTYGHGGRHYMPVNVSIVDDAVAIDSGTGHVCVLRSDDTLWCWGTNSQGQLGIGTTDSYVDVPTQVPLVSAVEAFDVGVDVTCARLDDGLLRCWGYNLYGGVGNGSVGGSQRSPVVVSGLGAVGIFSAGRTSCAVTTGGELRCWGRDWDGEITGVGGTTSYGTPQAVTAMDGLGVTPTVIDTSYTPTVLGADGRLWCWGSNANHECGVGVLDPEIWPATEVTGVTGTIVEIQGRCLRTDAGEVWCWGNHEHGSAGTGSFEYPYDTPRRAVEIADATQVYHWGIFSCIRRASGGVHCAGDNSYGQLGDGTRIDRNRFRPVKGMP